MVPVLKPHEGQAPVLRWCSDLRQLNKETKELRVALPTVEDNLDALAVAKIYYY